jgi:hypothetical protein
MSKKPHNLVVAFILTATINLSVQAQPYATSNNYDGRFVTLTDDACRYDNSLAEAYIVRKDDTKIYACYWTGQTKVFFRLKDGAIKVLPKSDFKLIVDII